MVWKWPWNNRKPVEIADSVTLLAKTHKQVTGQSCPYCKKETLLLRGIEKGRDGVELQVACICGLAGVINDSGFKYQHVPQREAKTRRRE